MGAEVKEYLSGFNFFPGHSEDPDSQTIWSSQAEFNSPEDAEAYRAKFDGVAGVSTTVINLSFTDYGEYIEQYAVEVVVDTRKVNLEEFKQAFGARVNHQKENER